MPSSHSSPAPSSPIRTAQVKFKRSGGRLTSGSWSTKELVLAEHSLLIQLPRTHKPQRQINLKDITQLTRVDLAPCCLQLTATVPPPPPASSSPTSSRQYYLSFTTDAELYDWQDDIYKRTPGGQGVGGPFGFKHNAHVGFETGDLNGLQKQFEKAVGVASRSATTTTTVAAPAASQNTSVNIKRASNPITVPALKKESDSVDEKASLASKLSKTLPGNDNDNIILEGRFTIKHRRSFLRGWFWRSRWISLTEEGLGIHKRQRSSNKSSKPETHIPLLSITKVDRVTRTPFCLLIVFSPPSASSSSRKNKKLYVAYESDSELYTWNDAIYLRTPAGGGGGGGGGGVGKPTNFVHHGHVGVDAQGGFNTNNVPQEWREALGPLVVHTRGVPPVPVSPPKMTQVQPQTQTHPATWSAGTPNPTITTTSGESKLPPSSKPRSKTRASLDMSVTGPNRSLVSSSTTTMVEKNGRSRSGSVPQPQGPSLSHSHSSHGGGGHRHRRAGSDLVSYERSQGQGQGVAPSLEAQSQSPGLGQPKRSRSHRPHSYQVGSPSSGGGGGGSESLVAPAIRPSISTSPSGVETRDATTTTTTRNGKRHSAPPRRM